MQPPIGANLDRYSSVGCSLGTLHVAWSVGEWLAISCSQRSDMLQVYLTSYLLAEGSLVGTYILILDCLRLRLEALPLGVWLKWVPHIQ